MVSIPSTAVENQLSIMTVRVTGQRRPICNANGPITRTQHVCAGDSYITVYHYAYKG